MFEFAASSILGAKRFVGVNENQETETLLRQNYTIEELESMQFVGEEQPLIKRNGIIFIRDGTVVRRYNAKSGNCYSKKDSLHAASSGQRETLPANRLSERKVGYRYASTTGSELSLFHPLRR